MIDRFSWVLPDQLAVGPFPKSASSLAFLRRIGITAVLSLTEPAEGALPAELRYQFVWQQVPIPDGFVGGVPTMEQFSQTLDILERWFAKRHVVYVHCRAGIGRSPAVCALYLAIHKRLPVHGAVDFVRSQHPLTDPTPAQLAVMQQLTTAFRHKGDAST